MVDLASLLIKVDASQVATGTKELDRLTVAGGRAEGAVKGTSAAAARLAADAQRMAASATLSSSRMVGLSTASGAAHSSVLRLGNQVGALTGQLATGTVGAQGLASALGRISLTALVAVPALGAVAAALGLASLAFVGMKQSAASDAEIKKFIDTLGLTRKEIKRLEDTTVTWGDTAKATFQVLAEAAGTSASEITGWFDWGFKKIGEFGKFSAALIYAGFVASAKGIINTWKAVPEIIGEAAVNAANLALQALEFLVNKGIEKINGLIAGINIFAVTDIPMISPVSIDRLENQWAGTTRGLADTLDADLHSAFNSAMSTMDAISARATDIAKDRIGDQADELIRDRPDKKGRKPRAAKKQSLSDEEKAYLAATKAAQAYIDALAKETDQIGLSAIETKRLDVAMAAAAARQAAAVAPTREGTAALLAQADAILKAGATWEKVYKADQLAKFIKDTIEPLERQASLIGLTAEQQARANLEFEKAAIIADYGAEAWERYAAAQGKIITEQFKVKSPFEEWAASIPQTAAQIATAMQEIQVRGFDGLATAITDVITGARSLKSAFKDLARSIIADIIQMTVRMLIFKAISGIIGGAGGGGGGGAKYGSTSALGNIFSHGNVIPFARGGIVGGPTLFPMTGGRTGLMGEKGPEAIMPLARDSQGRLGVANNNQSGPIEVIVHVETSEDLMVKAAVMTDARIAAAEPRIVRNAAGATMRAASRPTLMGRR